MANEKKNDVLGGEQAVTAPMDPISERKVLEDAAEIVGEVIAPFSIEREVFTLGNDEERQCYDYFIRGIFKKKDGEKEIKIHLQPRDVGGYEILDLLYDLSDGVCQFRLSKWHIKATKKGEKDSDGVSFVISAPAMPDKMRLKVKPKADSDKAALNMLLAFSGIDI